MTILSTQTFRSLSLAGNPITFMTNTSLLGAADTLEHLDIANLNLNGFEVVVNCRFRITNLIRMFLSQNGALNKIHFLRTLKISTYANIQNFNIPRVLENAHNLRELWIEAPKPPSKSRPESSVGPKTPKPVSIPSSDMRREMDGTLPQKLKSITFSGSGFNRLADNILKGVQSVSLHVSLYNTSIADLPDKFFKNIGKSVRNISLDLEYSNDLLKAFPNPNSAHYLHLPEHVFLTDLHISGNSLSCDCEIG